MELVSNFYVTWCVTWIYRTNQMNNSSSGLEVVNEYHEFM